MSSLDLERAFGSGPAINLGGGLDLEKAFGPPPPPKKKKKPGWSDVPGALWDEIQGIPAGAVGGAVALARDPVDTVGQMARGVYETWEPFFSGYANLITGDIEGYKRDKARFDPIFYQHPLGTSLQAAFGAGAAAGRITALGKLEPGATRVEILRAGVGGQLPGPRGTINVGIEGGGEITTRVLPKSAIRATRMQLTDRALKRLVPKEAHLIGEFARAARAVEKKDKQIWLKAIASPEAHEYERAWSKLNKTERAVVGWYNRFAGEGTDLASYKEMLRVRGTPEAQQTLAVLNSPRFMELFTNFEQHPKLRRGIEAAEKLMALRTATYLKMGVITPEEAATSPYRHLLMNRGNTVLTKGKAHKLLRKNQAALDRAEREKTQALKEARRVGKADIRRAVDAGAKVEMSQARTEKAAQRLTEANTKRERLQAQARNIQDELSAVFRGEFNTNLLSAMGIPLPSGTSIQGKITTEILDKEFEAEINALREQKARYEPKQGRLAEIDAEIAANTARMERIAGMQARREQTLSQEIAKNREQIERLDPERQQQWIQRLEQRNQTLQGRLGQQTYDELQRRNAVLRGQRERLVDLQAPARARLDAEIARVDKDRQDLKGAALTEQGWHDVRLQLIQKLEPMLKDTVDKLERAMILENRREQIVLKNLEIAERRERTAAGIGRAREARIQMLRAQRAKLNELLDAQQDLLNARREIKAGTGKLQGDVGALRAEIAARGGRQPFYWPDVPAGADKRRFASPSGSISPQRWRADVYNSEGILFRSGMLALHPDVLTPAYLRGAKHEFYSALHDTATKLAKPVARGEALPPGWEWLKTKYGEAIPYTEQMRAEHLRETGEVYSDLDEDMVLTSKDAKLDPAKIEKDAAGMRLAIPSRFADQFRNEFKSGKGGLARFAEQSLTVWRAMILHLRVPWLMNNIIGNAILTTLRFMGPNGAKAMLGLIYETKGAQGVARALKMDGVADRMKEWGLNESDVAELLPAQMRGTFLGANMPTLRRGEAVNRLDKAGRATVGFLPKIDRRTEQALRRLSVNAVLRGSPEVQALYKAMPKQTRSWRKAMREGLETDPKLQQLVNREVNDALGDFLSLSRNERNLIRQVVPFYAWMREITRVSGKTLLDTPGRAAVVALLAQVGQEQTLQDVPSYMRGAIPIGKVGGQQRALSTRAMTPWSTVADVGKSLSYFVPGLGDRESARGLLSEVNPYGAALVRGVTEVAQGRPASALGGALDPFWRTIESLPQYQVVNPRESEVFPDRARTDLLRRLLGDPTYVYDPRVAARKLREEQAA